MDFFLISKVLWGYFNPINILLFLLFIGVVFNFFNKTKLYKTINFITLILFILIIILPNGTYLLWKLENSYSKPEILPSKIDGIFILGGGTNELLTHQHDQMNLNESVERLTESAELIKKFPNAKIVYSGGTPTLSKSKPKFTGVDVAKMFYTRLGIDVNNIIFEDESRNTYENFLLSKKFIENPNNEKWLLVTSAFHMKRAMSVAEKLELNFIPYPVDFISRKNYPWMRLYLTSGGGFLANMNNFHLAAHEYVGIVVYYLTKKGKKIY